METRGESKSIFFWYGYVAFVQSGGHNISLLLVFFSQILIWLKGNFFRFSFLEERAT